MISAATQYTKLIETRKRNCSWTPLLFLENPQKSTFSAMIEPSPGKFLRTYPVQMCDYFRWHRHSPRIVVTISIGATPL